MAPKPWATDEQMGFLNSKLSGYLDAQKNQTTSQFLVRFYEDWFREFPELEEFKGPRKKVSQRLFYRC
jgi:hypothetical protein